MEQDTRSDDPTIRGLALRWICALPYTLSFYLFLKYSFRLPSLCEHMLEPLKRGLLDLNSYVRKVAAMACAKLFHLAPHLVRRIIL